MNALTCIHLQQKSGIVMQEPVMTFDNLAKVIHTILIDQGKVSIPKVGTLSLIKEPARLSRIERQIHPPLKTATFTYNPGIHSGSDAIKAGSKVIGLEALVQEELLGFTAAFGRGETLFLPKVGTFSWQQEGGYQFAPADFNYHLDVFGLGPVAAIPAIKRTAKEAAVEALTGREQLIPPAVVPVKPFKSRDRWFLRGLVAALFVIVGLVVWLILLRDRPEDIDLATADSMEEVTVDESELANQDDIMEVSDPEDPQDESAAEEISETASENPEVPSPVQTSPSEIGKERMIIVGHFSDASNAARLVSVLQEKGLDAAAVQHNQWQRVFVRVNEQTDDPAQMLAYIQTNFEKQAWLK